jgi:hypothetical protein
LSKSAPARGPFYWGDKNMGKVKYGYSNHQEKEFIRGLGTHSKNNYNKFVLLKKYKQALIERRDFTGLNPIQLLHFVNEEISKATK